MSKTKKIIFSLIISSIFFLIMFFTNRSFSLESFTEEPYWKLIVFVGLSLVFGFSTAFSIKTKSN